MFDVNRHKFFLVSLLKDIYSDVEVGTSLGFKGGTAQMLFYDLPRFSVDLDFNLVYPEKEARIFNKIRSIVLNYGTIRDEAQKHFGLILVLDYGMHERNLKIEISNRQFPDSYEIKNYLGIPVQVMVKSDLFAHKLCALLDRGILTNRDIFDIYYFLIQKTPVNKVIIEKRMKMEFSDYIGSCISEIEKIRSKSLLSGLGELVDADQKEFVKTKLKSETIQLLRIFRQFPLFASP